MVRYQRTQERGTSWGSSSGTYDEGEIVGHDMTTDTCQDWSTMGGGSPPTVCNVVSTAPAECF